MFIFSGICSIFQIKGRSNVQYFFKMDRMERNKCYIFWANVRFLWTFLNQISLFSGKTCIFQLIYSEKPLKSGYFPLNMAVLHQIHCKWAVFSSSRDPNQGQSESNELFSGRSTGLIGKYGPNEGSHLTYVHVFHARSRVFYYWGLGKIRLDGSYRR